MRASCRRPVIKKCLDPDGEHLWLHDDRLVKKTLMIKPHWFAGWPINLLGLDLCHEIPITSVRSVTETGKWFGYGKVELHFRSTEGEDKKLLLYLKKSGEFVEKLAGAIQHR